ncbi:MAG TPA: hypothetical protein VIH61_06700 [Waddliaceae bacterium]
MDTRRIFSVFFSFLTICFYIDLLAIEPACTGTLIVTYQTNKEGSCLDRIRFLVKGENYKQWLYPKGRSYFEDPITKMRKVVIENLPEGQYTIEFIVPNTDGFLAEVPIRQVKIASGAVVKIDQLIRPRELPSEKLLGSLIVSYDTGKDMSLLEEIKFSLVSEGEDSRIYPQNDNYYNASESDGRVVIISDLPEGHYSVEFFTEGRNGILSLENQKVEVQGNRTTTIHQSFAP